MNPKTRFLKGIAFAWLCVLLLLGTTAVQASRHRPSVRLAHTEWSSSVAAANLVKAVLQEKLDIRCELVSMSVDKMWAAVADGKADASVSAWLPQTHAQYYQRFKDRIVNLGPNLEGTKIGLVVPDITLGRLTAGTGIRNKPYITVDSIAELKDHADKFNHRIIGIEPEAGIMHKTRQAMEAYGLNEEFRLLEASEVSMVAELENAIRHQKWIVITGWLPHWIFARWNLKFLADPKDIYGGTGHISTIARQGMEKDVPQAYRFLDRFHWAPSDMGQLMMWIREDQGRFPYEKALRWMRTHPAKVRNWIEQAR